MTSDAIEFAAEAMRERLRAELSAAQRELEAAREQRDQLSLQLAACLTAAECDDVPDVEDGGYAWSLAFSKTRALRTRLAAVEAELRTLAEALREQVAICECSDAACNEPGHLVEKYDAARAALENSK